ncbi:MAG: hypothetical protein JSU73_04910 [candidate division WOR-3 bacterium]|nr:MAG: hypothetical protein JSU73_04910 [candidate division WOR-3 bacterium]
MSRSVLAAALLCAMALPALAAREWSADELDRFESRRWPPDFARPESLIYGPRRYNYLQRIKMMCDFVASYQVSDSADPEFGGIIESEHQPNIVETDNTQEAIWVWSRWYELTGRNDYSVNIRRAWRYVMNYPAFWEHNGNPSSIWYAVWNCGLAFMAESRYRAAYGDTTYRQYADSCRGFYIRNPLGPGTVLHNFVTSQSSGMAYPYALETEDQELRDTALARGARVQAWIEQDARQRLGSANWAMSGGTAMWGVCNTVCREDTAAGRRWLETYAESLPGFYPTGTWNCSHNIWLANAYRSAAEVLTGFTLDAPGPTPVESGVLRTASACWLMHHYLVDTLLTKDTDLDGGIPATWTDPDYQDQTWISTYMDFMGMDVFVTPTYDIDASVLAFVSPDPRRPNMVGDTLQIRVGVANVGLNPTQGWNLGLFIGGRGESIPIPSLGFLAIDTIAGSPFVPEVPGICQAIAIGRPDGDQNPLNDSSHLEFKVYGLRTISGVLTDSATGDPIHAWLKASITGDPVVWDSAETDQSGNFTLRIIDTTVTISLVSFPPYYDRSWDFTITGDTSIALLTQPAHIMIVNNDTLEQYAGYYTSTLDTLELTCFVWPRRSQGLPPWNLFDRLRTPTVIYFSGDATVNTVPTEDQDSLQSLAAHGLNLLITGQNIAEELAGTDFLEDFCGCRFDSSGWPRFFAFGDRSDSLGRTIYGTATAGGNGAGNQNSRDVLTPLGNAHSLLVYDTTSNPCAATRRLIGGNNTKVIFMGFGFEAVNRPMAIPTMLTRVQLMDKFLNWFEVLLGVSGPEDLEPRQPAVFAWPNPFHDRVVIKLGTNGDCTARGTVPACPLTVFDIQGRRVARLPVKGPSIVWTPTRLASGVYFVQTPGQCPALRVLKAD